MPLLLFIRESFRCRFTLLFFIIIIFMRLYAIFAVYYDIIFEAHTSSSRLIYAMKKMPMPRHYAIIMRWMMMRDVLMIFLFLIYAFLLSLMLLAGARFCLIIITPCCYARRAMPPCPYII